MNDAVVVAPSVVLASDLVSLAGQINAEHEQVISSVRAGAEHGWRIGKLLYEAKGLVRHGEWLDWVAVNCRFSDRAAQFYMQVYRANPQGISDLTLTDAIKQIEQLKSPPEPNERMISGGRPGRGKRDPVADAIKRDPTAVLEKAWAQAGEIERIAFANKIQKDLQPKQ